MKFHKFTKIISDINFEYIGKGCDNGKIFYRFYDVGTRYKNKGASESNKLFLSVTDYSLKGATDYNGSIYTVTHKKKLNNEKDIFIKCNTYAIWVQ